MSDKEEKPDIVRNIEVRNGPNGLPEFRNADTGEAYPSICIMHRTGDSPMRVFNIIPVRKFSKKPNHE